MEPAIPVNQERDSAAASCTDVVGTGGELKAAGIASVQANSDPPWMTRVLAVVALLAKSLPRFSIDDVRDECEEQGIGEPHHPNAWGGIMAAAAKAKAIAPTGEYEPSERAPARARSVRMWRSLHYQRSEPVIKTHENPDVAALLRATRGQVIFDPLYMPPVAVLQEGYETIKRMYVWSCDQAGVEPANPPARWKPIVEILTWMRDHWGPEIATVAAAEKYKRPSFPSTMPTIEEAALAILRKATGNEEATLESLDASSRAKVLRAGTAVLALVSDRVLSAAGTSPGSPSSGPSGGSPPSPTSSPGSGGSAATGSSEPSIDTFNGGPASKP